MNWRPSLIAAVIVIAAGVASGAVIGGRTETVRGPTRTVTVTAADSPAASTSPETSGEPTPAADGAATMPAQPLTAELLHVGDNVEDVEVVARAQLPVGEALSESAQFSLVVEYDGATPDHWFIEVDVPVGATTFTAIAGFAKGMPSGNRLELELIKNELEGKPLSRPYQLDSASREDVRADVAGAAKVIVKVSTDQPTWRTPPEEDRLTFLLGDAQFT